MIKTNNFNFYPIDSVSNRNQTCQKPTDSTNNSYKEVSSETYDKMYQAADSIGRAGIVVNTTKKDPIDEILENIDLNNNDDIAKLLDLYDSTTKGYTTCSNEEEYKTVYLKDTKIGEFINEKLTDKIMQDETLATKYVELILQIQSYKAIADNKPFALYRGSST